MRVGPGTRQDAYEIIRPLGAGGMGEVWLAKDLRLQRPVALKFLPTDLTTDPVRVARFQQEARAASALNHPNICTIYALGDTPDGHQFIAMEYVDGETLRQRLARGRLPLGEALDLAIQIATALSAAHAAGVVRDPDAFRESRFHELAGTGQGFRNRRFKERRASHNGDSHEQYLDTRRRR